MQGYEIKYYVGGELSDTFREPVNFEKIVKSWAPTIEEAIKRKEELASEYSGVAVVSGKK